MTINPMQKKSRNSFLLGVVITLIICLIIGGLCFFLLGSKNKEKEEERGQEVIAYVLSQDVKSGQEINSSMLMPIEVYSSMIPANYIDLTTMNSLTQENPYIAKTNILAKTIVTSDIITKSDEKIENDTRYMEYNMITLQTTAEVGDYIDIRLSLPNGQDYLVVSKAKIENLQDTTIGLNLSEEEILMMNSAMVDAYIMTASNFHAVKYIEPGNQTKAAVTYTPTAETRALIAYDTNIVSEARTTLEARFSDGVRTYIDSTTGLYVTQSLSNIETGIQKQIEDAKTARENYLKSIPSVANIPAEEY